MKKSEYRKPAVAVVKTTIVRLLTDSTQKLYFNPNEGTVEALSRGSGSRVWDDDEEGDY